MNSKILTGVAGAVLLAVVVGGYLIFGKSGYKAPPENMNGGSTGGQSSEQPTVTPAAENKSTSGQTEREISVSGTEYKFTPSEITVSAGEKVKITFTNNGTSNHNLTISGLDVGTATISPGESASFEFTAPNTPGTYEFSCTIPGHKDLGMKGKVIVQ